jgi:phenylpyruvate tautomerase PptA (4-oxalocrotonate tautomerase family)
MPISIQLSKGLLTSSGEREVFPLIANLLLKVHGLEGNSFMTPIVIGHLDIYDEAQCYAGGRAQSLAIVEVKVPPVTFPEQSVKDAFVAGVADIIDKLKAGNHPKERTFVNVAYAVEGTWGIGDKAYTNDMLGEAIQKAAHK